jgi:hypothetical protein
VSGNAGNEQGAANCARAELLAVVLPMRPNVPAHFGGILVIKADLNRLSNG